jgi:hypothetical protein
MKKLFFLACAVIICSLAFAQKTIHDPNVELRKVTGFTAIEVSGGIDLYLSNGDEAVAVSAKDEKVRSRIRTEVTNGVLKIYYDWKDGFKLGFGRNESMKAYVSYKTLNSLEVSGGADAIVDGVIRSSELNIHVSGGADFKGKVEVDNLNISQSGGADVNISGTAKTLKVRTSGGSDLDGYELVTEICVAEASGGSDISITVSKEITAEASGGSDISWKGSASVKRSSTSGAGSVSHRS